MLPPGGKLLGPNAFAAQAAMPIDFPWCEGDKGGDAGGGAP